MFAAAQSKRAPRAARLHRYSLTLPGCFIYVFESKLNSSSNIYRQLMIVWVSSLLPAVPFLISCQVDLPVRRDSGWCRRVLIMWRQGSACRFAVATRAHLTQFRPLSPWVRRVVAGVMSGIFHLHSISIIAV